MVQSAASKWIAKNKGTEKQTAAKNIARLFVIFTASPGWLFKTYHWHGLGNLCVSGEAGSIDMEAV